MLSLLVIRQDTHVFESKVKQMEKLQRNVLNSSENDFYMILLCHDETWCNASKVQNNFTLARSTTTIILH